MINKAGTVKILENWEFTLRDNESGEIINHQIVTNTLTNVWKNVIRDWMYDGTGGRPVALAIGTGTTEESASDTILEIEYSRETAVVSKPAAYQVKYSKDFTFGSGVSEDITEAGIFDSAVVSGSNMIARTTFSAVSVTASTTLTVEGTLTVA